MKTVTTKRATSLRPLLFLPLIALLAIPANLWSSQTQVECKALAAVVAAAQATTFGTSILPEEQRQIAALATLQAAQQQPSDKQGAVVKRNRSTQTNSCTQSTPVQRSPWSYSLTTYQREFAQQLDNIL